MSDDELVTAAHALGDGRRFAVLRVLLDAGEMSCGDIAARVGVSQPTASHHLRILGEAGLVEVRHVAQRSFFSVVEERLEAFAATLRELLGAPERLPDLGAGVID